MTDERRGRGPRDESEDQRLDRNLIELLNELRVALPGVQVLFAFLLVVPFNQRFVDTTGPQRLLYLAVLALTAASSVFLIAPSFHHRLQFRRQAKEEVVVVGNTLALIGLTLLALAMTGAVLLVTDFLFGGVAAIAATVAVAVLYVVVWYALPLHSRRRRTRSSSVV
jgi:Family of unknown function (DUF6328)